MSDGSSAIGLRFSSPSYTTAGAKIAQFRNNTTEKLAIDKDGKLLIDSTDSSGSPGAATINKPAGKVAIASGASSVTVTNSLVTTASHIYVQIQSADTTLTSIKSVVPGSGSFTITGNANATAACKVCFFVIN